MMISGYPVSEIILSVFVILWAVVKYSAIVMLIISVIWLAMNAGILFIFIVGMAALARAKVNW